MYVLRTTTTYIRTYVQIFAYISDDSDNNVNDATPLIKPASDPDISTTLMTTTTTKWLQHKATNFFKAFCIPGVVVVRYGPVCDVPYNGFISKEFLKSMTSTKN